MIRRRRRSRCRRGASTRRHDRDGDGDRGRVAVDPALLPGGAPLGGDVERAMETTPAIDIETVPYDAAHHWPHALESSRLPLTVNFGAGQDDNARRVLELLEEGWDAHLALGFRAPPLIPARERYDAWLWYGLDEVSVAARDEVALTSWDDAFTYMIVDPVGQYGGDELRHTMTHEMSHVFQGSDDWYEFASAYEGSATFVEWLRCGLNDRLREVVQDFQRRPHWSVDRDDGSETWHTYGFAMYLRYLHHAHAGGDAAFLGKAWEAARNAPRAASADAADDADDAAACNEADLIDALERVVPGLRYPASIAGFARWRWYTGDRADRHHDPDAARLAHVAAAKLALGRKTTARLALDPAPMLLGAGYVDVDARAAAIDDVSVVLEAAPPPGVEFTVQAVPGLDGTSDGETLAFEGGRARLRLGPDRRRTVIVTAAPAADAPYDPDTRTDDSYPVKLTIERTGS